MDTKALAALVEQVEEIQRGLLEASLRLLDISQELRTAESTRPLQVEA